MDSKIESVFRKFDEPANMYFQERKLYESQKRTKRAKRTVPNKIEINQLQPGMKFWLYASIGK